MLTIGSSFLAAFDKQPDYPLTSLAEELTEDHLINECYWRDIPEIKNFRIRSTDNYFTTGNYSARAAYQKNRLWIRIECNRGDNFYFAMQKRYQCWMLDNGAEIFLKAPRKLHKFVINARQAICYSLNGESKPLPSGCIIKGQLDAGRWCIVFSIPCDRTRLEQTGLNIHINQPYSFTVYCAMTNDTCKNDAQIDPVGRVISKPKNEMRFAQFKLFDKSNKQGIHIGEQKYNNDFYQMLKHFDGCPEIDELARYEKLCNWDLSKIKLLIKKIKNYNGSLIAKEQLYRTLRQEFARFQCKIYPIPQDSFIQENSGPLMVDFSRDYGKIRPLSGTNIGPRIYSAEYLKTNEEFKKMNFSYVRLHDVPLDNPGIRLVDTSLIFANFHDDPHDPRNYFFKPTDDYLLNIHSLGCGVVYRLGVSIEHSVNKYAAHAPEDYEKFAEICAGIVRHYNAGWANGYKMGIKYWEIWNEPNIGPKMWDRGMDEFFKLYVTVAKRLKKEFPNIKIGGYGSATFNQDHLIDLMKKCLKEKAPLDFYSWHLYNNKVQTLVTDPYYVRGLLDAFGFKNTEIHFNEWHYFENNWSDFSSPEGFKKILKNNMSIHSGVFTAQVLSRWQDSPLNLSNYYSTFSSSWGVRDYLKNYNKNYYALVAYGEIVKYPHRVRATSNNQDCFVLAGHDDKGNAAILVTAFKYSQPQLELVIRGVPEIKNLTVKILDDKRDLQKINVPMIGEKIVLPKVSQSSLFLINFNTK